MPVKTTNIDVSESNIESKEELSEFELRKQAWGQIVKDTRMVSKITGRILFVVVFLYGFFSILQDVNLL